MFQGKEQLIAAQSMDQSDHSALLASVVKTVTSRLWDTLQDCIPADNPFERVHCINLWKVQTIKLLQKIPLLYFFDW